MKPALDDKIHRLLNERLKALENHLSDNNKWKSHGRPIDIHALKGLRLEIDDYSDSIEKRTLIRDYYELVADCVLSRRFHNFVHTRKFI